MSEFGVAVIGAGSMAREHVRAFSAIPDIRVRGIYSRTRGRAAALADELAIPMVAGSIDELAERTGADLVVVAVPELAANAVAKASFRHDWAVLLEKPAGYDLADAEDIAAAARDRGQPVLVGFNRRFYSSALTVKADLDSRPEERRFIHVQDQQSFAEARRHDHPEPVVQRFMYANSIHNIDLLAFLGRGELERVTPVMPWQGEDTEVVLAHLSFAGGDSGLYEGIWKGPGPWACSVGTPSRRWMLQPLEQARFQNVGERSQNAVEAAPVDSQFKAGFLCQAEAAIARTRGAPSAAVDIEESLRTMRLIHGIFGA